MTGQRALFVTTVDITLEVFLLPFADRLRADGWQVDALARGASANPVIAPHFDATFEAQWDRSPLDLRNFTSTADNVRALIERGRYDLVHVHTPVAAFVTRLALRDRTPGRPVVVYTAHGFHFLRGGNPITNIAYRALESTAARWTDQLVTINDEDYAAARAFQTIDPQRVSLIPGIGVDCDLYSPTRLDASGRARVRAELGADESTFLVTMVAEFAPVKRHALALEALSRVTDPRVLVAFVGEGPLEDAMRAAVEEMGLSERVCFAGYRRDVPDVLAASDALMLVSAREGRARSVLEAMATGIPVIGTDTRGIADSVAPDAGWIVQADPESLAAALEAAAQAPDEVARRGAIARERAVREFSFEHVFDAYEELYARALA